MTRRGASSPQSTPPSTVPPSSWLNHAGALTGSNAAEALRSAPQVTLWPMPGCSSCELIGSSWHIKACALPGAVVNCYVPNSGDGLKRLEYRLKAWDVAFAAYLEGLGASKPVILTGDLNCAHQEIDIHNPKKNLKSAGFTPARDSLSCHTRKHMASATSHLTQTVLLAGATSVTPTRLGVIRGCKGTLVMPTEAEGVMQCARRRSASPLPGCCWGTGASGMCFGSATLAWWRTPTGTTGLPLEPPTAAGGWTTFWCDHPVTPAPTAAMPHALCANSLLPEASPAAASSDWHLRSPHTIM